MLQSHADLTGRLTCLDEFFLSYLEQSLKLSILLIDNRCKQERQELLALHKKMFAGGHTMELNFCFLVPFTFFFPPLLPNPSPSNRKLY